MRRVWHYLVLGAVVYLVALAAGMPAERALQFARPALAGANVVIAGVDGSVWRGSAASVKVQRGPTLAPVRWDLNLLPLLAGRLAADWDAGIGNGGLHGAFSARGTDRFLLNGVEGRFPIDAVAPLLPLPLPIGGDVTVDLASLTMADGRPVAAEGVLVWSKAAVTAPQMVPLGDLRIDLTPRDGGGISGRLADGGGPLELSGEITIDPNGAYRLSASVGTRNDAVPALTQALPLLGRRGPGGKYLISYNGRL